MEMVWQNASWMINKSLHLFDRVKSSPESVDYRQWQHRFLLNRLRLTLFLAFACLLTFVLRDLYGAVFQLQELAELPPHLLHVAMLTNGIMAALLILILLLRHTRLGKRHPAVLFLGMSWSITLMPQIVGTLYGTAFPDILSWTLVFLTQATFMPMRWELHLISQLGAIGYYIVINLALGTTTIAGEPIYSASGFLYLFWFCFICDLAVYLYERLQRTEFESRREMQAFVNALTHDLRTPVMGTSMVLQNLLQSQDERITVNRLMLERMLQGSDRQMNLINSLIEAHTLESQACSMCRKPVQLSEVVQAALKELEAQLSQSQVVVVNYLSDPLPLVKGDFDQLLKVFKHLITNALKHNPPGITLTLDADVDRKTIRCLVQDTGHGIPPHQCETLFDSYARGQNARYVPGLGFGLRFCQRIIKAHRGQIGVSSVPGKGATIWFTLPRLEHHA